MTKGSSCAIDVAAGDLEYGDVLIYSIELTRLSSLRRAISAKKYHNSSLPSASVPTSSKPVGRVKVSSYCPIPE
jgi:hypothetical protein